MRRYDESLYNSNDGGDYLYSEDGILGLVDPMSEVTQKPLNLSARSERLEVTQEPLNLSTRSELLEEQVKQLERRVDDLEAEVATLRNINRRRNY